MTVPLALMALSLALAVVVLGLGWLGRSGRTADRIHRYQIASDTPAELSLADLVAEGIVHCIRHPDRDAVHIVQFDGADLAVCGACFLDLAGRPTAVTPRHRVEVTAEVTG
jgi:hypothetical protein